MESHNSQEKLMSLEAGLIHPETLSLKKPSKSSGCTKRILVYFTTVLLVVVGYEIWQAVRMDYLMQKLEDGKRTLPLKPESRRIEDMAEELKRVQFALKEMKEQMEQRPQVTPDKPKIIESISDQTIEDWERKWLVSVLPERSNDYVKLSNSDSEIPGTTESSDVTTIVDEEIEVPTLEPEVNKSQINESGSGWIWNFHFTFGTSAEDEKSPTEKLDVIETDVGTPTEVENVSSNEEPDWSWLSFYGEQDKSDNEEQKKAETVDTTTTPKPIDDDYASYIYGEYDEYEWYHHGSSTEPGDYGDIQKPTPTPDEVATEHPTTKSSPTLTPNEDEPEDAKAEIMLTTVSTDPQTDIFVEARRYSAIPIESVVENNDDKSEAIDRSVSGKSVMEEIMEFPWSKKLETAPHWADVSAEARQDIYDDEYGVSDLSDEEGWSYISKRSIDTSSNERPRHFLSPEQVSRKLAVIQQAVDDDNHILQNEVDVASKPAKSILRQKLNDFYRKMEAVSAHIDRLHQRYLDVNGLDDDYVSREFPSDE